MKNLLTILIVLIVAAGCGEEEKLNSSEINTIVEEEFEYDEEKETEWYENNIAPLNQNLLLFKLRVSTSEEYKELEDLYYDFNIKHEDRPKRSDFLITEYEDSVVVTFWQWHVFFCSTHGNAHITEDQVTLFFGDVCSPFSIPIDGEEALVNWKYVFKNVDNIASKEFTVVNSIDTNRTDYN